MVSRAAAAFLARSRRQETFRTAGPSGGGVRRGVGRTLALQVKARGALRRAESPTVRQAGITSPGKAIIAAVVRTPLARSVLRKIPGISRLVPGSKARVAAGERQLGFTNLAPGSALALRGGAPLARVASLAKPAAKIAAVGGTFAVGEEVIKRAFESGFQGRRGQPIAQRRPKMAGSRGLAVGQELPPSHVVVRTWQTFPGGPVFARLADGHIAVQKKDGTIKHFRPYRPVVIPRKWNARSMSRVATALKRQRKTATKIMQITGGMPKGRK